MANLPDLVGYRLEDGEKILKEAGINYRLIETSSPRNDVEGDEHRIVRQIMKDEVLEITLCRY